MQGDAGGGYGGGQTGEGGSGGGQTGAYEFGVDPNLDPELAMALRVSLEEERARQAQPGDAAAPDAQAPAGGMLSLPDCCGATADLHPFRFDAQEHLAWWL